MAQYVGYYKQHNNTNNTSDTDSSYCPDTKYKDREPTKKEFGIENINENNYKKIKEKGDKISSIQMDLAFILIGWIGIGISIILVLLNFNYLNFSTLSCLLVPKSVFEQ